MMFARSLPVLIVNLCVVVFLVCPSPAFTAGTGGWGAAHIDLLVLIHPEMAAFDFSRGLFFRNNPAAKEANDLRQEQLTGWKNSEKILIDLNKRRGELLAERMGLMLQRDAVLGTSAQPSSNNQKGQKPSLSPNERMRKEAGFITKVNLNQTRLLEVEAQLRSTFALAEKNFYLTPEETLSRFQHIQQDIARLVQQTAGETRLSVVLDSSFKGKTHLLDPNTRILPKINGTGGLLAYRLFHFLRHWKIKTPEKSVLAKSGGDSAIKAFFKTIFGSGLGKSLAEVVRHQPHLSGPTVDFSAGNICISGWTDITHIVAQKLLTRYQIPVEFQNSFAMFIRDFVSFERTTLGKFAPK